MPKDWLKRDISWSFISSFEYSPEQWYDRYVLHKSQHETSEMAFGKAIGEKLASDPKFLPQIPRHSKMEHQFKDVKFGKLTLVGYADTFCDKTFKKLSEFKTGKRAWDQKRADEHGQIDMYLLMNWIINKVKPEEVDVTLVWMPTEDRGDFSIAFVKDIENKIKIFNTKRTMLDILKFGKRLNDVYKEMKKYVKERQKLEN